MTNLFDYKDDLMTRSNNTLNENFYLSTNFLYSQIWRIRISDEGKSIVNADSLVACTKVDSIYYNINRNDINRPLSSLYSFEFNIRNLCVNLTDNQQNMEIMTINVNDLLIQSILRSNNDYIF